MAVKKNVKTIKGNKHLKTCLVECGWGATRKKNGVLKTKYTRLVKRRGKKKALVAIGHAIIVAAYFMIRDKVPYQPVQAISEEELRKKQAAYHLRKAQELGLNGSMN